MQNSDRLGFISSDTQNIPEIKYKQSDGFAVFVFVLSGVEKRKNKKREGVNPAQPKPNPNPNPNPGEGYTPNRGVVRVLDFLASNTRITSKNVFFLTLSVTCFLRLAWKHRENCCSGTEHQPLQQEKNIVKNITAVAAAKRRGFVEH